MIEIPTEKQNPFQPLPKFIVVKILSELDIQQICKMRVVCKELYFISSYENIWIKKLEKDFNLKKIEDNFDTFFEFYVFTFNASKRKEIIALFDYQSQEGNELSFKMGDILTVINEGFYFF
jgi:hypothetical protein